MNAKHSRAIIGAAAIALAGCSPEAEDPAAVEQVAEPAIVASARAELIDVGGNGVGTVKLTEVGGTLLLRATVRGLTPGLHGAHIHTTGKCDPPDFASAGGHWNPDNMNHGTESDPPNPHAGDLPNIEVGTDGTGLLETSAGGTFDALLDADGAALVIDMGPDDYITQPSGNAGARIVCGVFEPS